jgi:tetratricopeptide (TPR) repeat protein
MSLAYRIKVAFMFAALVFVLAAGCGEKSGRARAEEFITAGMYQEAVPVLQMRIQSNPTDAEAHFLLGKAFLGIHDSRSAGEEFQRAGLLTSSLGGRVGSAYLEIGSVYLSKADLQDVEYGYDLLRTAVEKTPSLSHDVAMRLRQTGLLLYEDAPQTAQALLNEAIRLDAKIGGDEEVQFALACVPSDPGERKKRFEAFATAFPKSPMLSHAYREIGRCYYALGDYENAKTRLQYTCDHFPGSEDAQEAEKLLETISHHEEEMQRIEKERADVVTRAEKLRIEAEQRTALETARLKAQQEQARAEAERLKKEQEAWEARIRASGGPYWVRAYNGDDGARILLNGSEVVRTGFGEDSGFVEISSKLKAGANYVSFIIDNTRGAITYGFQLRGAAGIIWEDKCGKAGSVGCNNNETMPVGEAYRVDRTITID